VLPRSPRPFPQTSQPLLRSPLTLPFDRSISAILLVDGPGPLPDILDQLARLPLKEIIAVVEGEGSLALPQLLEHPARPIPIHHPEPLGPGIGRSIAARAAQEDILLFVDSAVVIAAEELLPLLMQIGAGADVALNNITPGLGNFADWEPAVNAQVCLNRLLGRGDLGANSLAALPHAMCRKVPETVGYSALAVPPLAHALALAAGLAVCAPVSIGLPPGRPYLAGSGDAAERQQLALGDHIEALQALMKRSGTRLGYPDRMRKRHIGEAVP